jgi:inhibitor of growth (ING)-like protein
MKSAKAPASAAEGPSIRRSQPARQTRTNPPRVSNLRGPIAGRDSVPGAAASDQPIEIYPAITFFADAMTALPKELVRHFTLLKEVDAKIYGPEDALFQLVDAAMNTPAPDPNRPNLHAIEASAPASAAMSAQNSSTGVVAPGQAPTTAPSTNGSQAPSTSASAADPRRQLYHQTAFKIQEMLGSLEEKNHVISTANEALQKQLARIDDVWPHLENEFSDEAKWGSTTHWAYPENRAGNKAAHAERSRREGAAAISAAAQQLADEAAARSDARKQAVQAKKNLKAQNQENDADDAEGRGKTETTKKSTAKARKAADAAAAAAAAAANGGSNVGLGITNGTTNGAAPQPKRRKVEKTAAKDAPPERAMASVFGPDAPKAKTSSPRGTPAPDGPKKRKALPTGSGQTKKRFVPSSHPNCAACKHLLTSLQQDWSYQLTLRCLVPGHRRLSRTQIGSRLSRPRSSKGSDGRPREEQLCPFDRRERQGQAIIVSIQQAQRHPPGHTRRGPTASDVAEARP